VTKGQGDLIMGKSQETPPRNKMKNFRFEAPGRFTLTFLAVFFTA